MILLLKASLVIIFLLSFYKLFLEKESFFSANRIYLLCCLIFACLLPLIVLPKISEYQGYVENKLIEAFDIESKNTPLTNNISNVKPSQHLNPEVLESDNNLNRLDQRDETSTQENSTPEHSFQSSRNTKSARKSSKKSYGFLVWMNYLYLFGVIVLSINLIGQMINVMLKVKRNKDKIEDEGIVIVNMATQVEPCSFFKYIFIHPPNYDFDTYEQIIAHEKIHVNNKHSIDLILAEIAKIVLWFNPFVWILRKEIEKNIEYQTDDSLMKRQQNLKETYQLNLVKIACNTSPLAITTNYNQSLIKQRILRLNAKKSNQFSYWKYAFSMPLVFVLILILNRPVESVAQFQSPVKNFNDASTVGIIDSIKNEQFKDSIVEEENKSTSKTDKNASFQFADCAQFEKAVADGDLIKVKEILKILDPKCLEIKNNKDNLNTIQELLENKKADINYKKGESNPHNVIAIHNTCEILTKAVLDNDVYRTRDILQNEDITCLGDINGGPSKDIALIKGLLSYGAAMYIQDNYSIKIDVIRFEIDISDTDDSDCKDPGYLRLVEAIKDDNHSKIRNILTNESLTCPLNSNGIWNDFIFIKEMMKYNPKITNINSEVLYVGGLSIVIDIENKINHQDSPNYINNTISKKDLKVVLQNMEKGIDSVDKKSINASDISCQNLIEAVNANNFVLANKILKLVDPNCFHRETETITNGEDKLTVTNVNTPLIAAVRMQNISFVKTLLDNQADVNYSGDGQETPLIAATKTGNLKLVKMLVKNEAFTNRRDNAKLTALDYAKYKNYSEIAKFLEENGEK